MNLYLVCFCRDNKVETIIKLTKSLHLAHLALLDTVSKTRLGSSEAAKVLKDIAAGEITDNVTILINEDNLNLQLFSWDEGS